VPELDRRRIVTKRRSTKVAKYQGGIPFTYGPLAYLLKNRIYVGEIHHGGKWFKGEHEPILDRQTFDQVQHLLKENTVRRRLRFSESGALLMGKLFDDEGNRMGPSFSSKNGVRYRFYISSALRGRKDRAGSVARISAAEIEGLVEAAVREKLQQVETPREEVPGHIERIVVSADRIRIFPRQDENKGPIEIPWNGKAKGETFIRSARSEIKTDQKLLKSVVRAHAWLTALSTSRHGSVEDLAETAGLHPKVVRQGLRLAFLAPELTTTVLDGDHVLKLKQIPKLLPLSWREQRRLLE
jgi:hypothetical protein